MTLLLIAISSIALILFMAFVASRLVRSRKAGLSIRMQVFLALAGIVGTFALGVGLLVVDRVKARATMLAEESARSEATAIAALVRNEIEVRDKSLDEVARDLGSMRDVRMSLLDPDDRVILVSGEPLGESEAGVVSVTVPIEASGRRVGSVRVVKPTIVIQRMLADFAPTILIISVVLGAAAALSAALIGRAIATPIEDLTDFAVRVSSGQLVASPPTVHGREVMRLTQAIESMRRELEGRPFVETFAADLSHELKNPVAAIRASAEVLADGALEEPALATKFVNRIQESTTRIEALLGDLLSLARIEARGVEDAEIVDLTAIIEETASRARERGQAVEVRAEPASVRGDASWLARLVDNMVDNAVQHGAPDSPVRVDVSHRRGAVVVEVTNEGEIAEHVRKRLFKRFVTTRPDRGGTGLGLAIARAVAEAHKGRIACAAHGPPEVTFRLRLPEA
ncbi:MAG: ATP-binding protein [Polyangiaceae bacterium]